MLGYAAGIRNVVYKKKCPFLQIKMCTGAAAGLLELEWPARLGNDLVLDFGYL